MSYGIYIAAFPISQAFAHYFPRADTGGRIAFTVAVGLAYAAFSWTVIEGPILKRKSPISRFVERLFGVRKAVPAPAE